MYPLNSELEQRDSLVLSRTVKVSYKLHMIRSHKKETKELAIFKMEFSENTENQRCAGLDEVSHLQPAKDFQSTTKAWEQRSYPGN